jgi:hypothetical protein
MFKGFVMMKTFNIATEARTNGFFKNSSTENGTVLDGDFLAAIRNRLYFCSAFETQVPKIEY